MTEAECARERDIALSHLQQCDDSSACAVAEHEVEAAASRLTFLRDQRERGAIRQREQVAARTRAREAAAVAEGEARERETYGALDLRACESTGEEVDCAPLQSFIHDFPDGAHRRAVDDTLERGQRARRAQQIESEKQAYGRRLAERREEEARQLNEARRQQEDERRRQEIAEQQVRPPASKSKPKPPVPVNEGRVCCCDGTTSPTCTYVHRGCCSHHGGVCDCE